MSRGGGPKKYRKEGVIKACVAWKDIYGLEPFTAKDLYESGLITFQQKTQHISSRSVSFLVGVLEKQGLLEVVEDGQKKKQSTYRCKA